MGQEGGKRQVGIVEPRQLYVEILLPSGHNKKEALNNAQVFQDIGTANREVGGITLGRWMDIKEAERCGSRAESKGGYRFRVGR